MISILDFIGAKDDGCDSVNWSYDEESSSQNVTTNKRTHNFLQAGCPSCRPTNSVRAPNGEPLRVGKYEALRSSLAADSLGRLDP